MVALATLRTIVGIFMAILPRSKFVPSHMVVLEVVEVVLILEVVPMPKQLLLHPQIQCH